MIPHIYSAQGTLEDIRSALNQLKNAPSMAGDVVDVIVNPLRTSIGGTIVSAKDYLGSLDIDVGAMRTQMGGMAGNISGISTNLFQALQQLQGAADYLRDIAGGIADVPVNIAGLTSWFNTTLTNLVNSFNALSNSMVSVLGDTCADEYAAYRRGETDLITAYSRCAVNSAKDLSEWGVQSLAKAAAFSVTIFVKQLANLIQGGLEGAASQVQVRMAEEPTEIPANGDDMVTEPAFPRRAQAYYKYNGQNYGRPYTYLYQPQAMPQIDFGAMLGPVVESLGPVIRTTGSELGKYTVIMVYEIAKSLGPVVTDIAGDVGAQLKTWMSALGANVLAYLTTLWNRYIMPAAQRAVQFIGENIGRWSKDIGSVLWTLLEPIFGEAGDWIQNQWSMLGARVLRFLRVYRPWMGLMKFVGVRNPNWALLWLGIMIIFTGVALETVFTTWVQRRTEQALGTEEAPKYPVEEAVKGVVEDVKELM